MTLYKLQCLLPLIVLQERRLIGLGRGVCHMTRPLCYFCCYKSDLKAEEPSLPLCPELPVINVPSSTLQSERLKMVNNEHLSDVQFYYKTSYYHGYKVVLCMASELFRRIFEIGREVEGEEGLSHCNTWSKKRLNTINRQCINMQWSCRSL